MKVLLDTCVWGGAKKELSELGHDVVWAGDWPEDPGDSEILSRAYNENRVLVTLDKDFGELAVVHGSPHSGIIRLVGLRAIDQARVCDRIVNQFGEALLSGSIVTAEPGRFRVRPR